LKSQVVVPPNLIGSLLNVSLRVFNDIRMLIPFRLTITYAVLICTFLLFAETSRAQDEPDPAVESVALFNKGQDAHEKGDFATALKSYEKALAVMPQFPEAELQRGYALLALEQTAAAEASFRRAVSLRPDWSLAVASLGSLLVSSEKFAEAETVLTKAIELDSQNFPAIAAMADLRVRTRAKPEVIRPLLAHLRLLTAKAKTPASIWAAHSALESTFGDLAAAKTSAERAVALEPGNQLALNVLFDAAIAEQDVAAANELFSRLVRLKPNSRTLPLLRARILITQDKQSEALAVLNEVQNPDAAVSELRARIMASGDATAPELEKMLERDANDPHVLGRLCSALRVENPAKALEYCRRASEAEPDNISHAIGYGAALVQAKNYGAAVSLFRKILKITPDNYTVRANLATALFQLKDYAAAKPEYLWLTQKQPNTAAAYFFLALTHDHLGEYLDAMANYQQFLRLSNEKENGLEIEKVKLRLPPLEKQIKGTRRKKPDAHR